MIDELCRHIFSDEPAEDVDERGQQRFDRRRNGYDPVQRGSSCHALEVNGVVVSAPKVSQRWMLGLRSQKRSCEERVASVGAE